VKNIFGDGEIRKRRIKPYNCTSAVDRKSKFETYGRSGGKKNARSEYVIHVFMLIFITAYK